MIIQAGFADGDDFGMPGEFAQRGAQIIGGFGGFGGMPANDGKDAGKFFRERHRATAALEARADGNDSCNTGCLGAGDDVVQIRGVIGIIQVRVRVEEGEGITV